ncbi:hypothetical protein OCU04_006060 [Sclerotinia nivalis]|uniref:Uncharacterized protein n=1 Tax=Sclerotinia nivalis TaxID=352851 RepID=A0A9X0DKV9_9HELO|nr:hypothetical protein OCU04_006060 [Sclerotinia nivalis]
MSSLPKFTLPEMFGNQRGITSPQSPISTAKQVRNSGKCMFIVQEYHCPHHAHLSSPHLLHRSPCWEALLPREQQKECENYTRREGKMVQVARYEKERGCMDCKAIARARRREEATKHAEIIRKMEELGLADDSIEDFEKVAGSSPASKRVVAHVKARAKEMAEKEALKNRGSEAKQKEKENEAKKQKIQPKKEHDAPIKTNIAETIQSPNSARSQSSSSTQLHAEQQEVESTPTIVQNLDPESEPEIVTKEHEIISNTIHELDEEFNEGELSEELDDEGLEHSTSIPIFKDTEWDLSEENGRIWGEVALAPGVTTAKEDEWVVLGSWETGE